MVNQLPGSQLWTNEDMVAAREFDGTKRPNDETNDLL
jgi:hypothetical protein